MFIVTPYYSQDGIAIYHGDCRNVLADDAAMRTGSGTYDLLLTDPPYGLKEAHGKNASRGNIAVAQDYGVATWDDAPEHEALAVARSRLFPAPALGDGVRAPQDSSRRIVGTGLLGPVTR